MKILGWRTLGRLKAEVQRPEGESHHVVVGPTGVFILDAKNCRGLVTADGHGELLVNGERPKDLSIRGFV